MVLELFLTLILPIGLMAALLVYLMRKMTTGGGMMGIGKSNAKMYMEKENRRYISGCGRRGRG